MNDRQFIDAERAGDTIILKFWRGDSMFTLPLPMHEIGKLLTGCANAIREHHQLSPVEHQQIELAVLEGLDTETRVAKAVNAVQTVRPPGATQPMILHLELGTETGPMTLRITQIAAQELAAELNKHPLTRGSA